MKSTKKLQIGASGNMLQKGIILTSLVLIIIVFTCLSDNFFTLSNLSGILLATTVNGILSIGITYVMIGGGCDISVGTNMTLCGVMMAVFATTMQLPIWLSVVLAVAGLYCLCITEDFTITSGDFYILLCALCFSVHILVIDHFTQKVDGVELSCVQFLMVTVLSAVGMLAMETPSVEALKMCVGPILYLGIFSSGVAYTLQILAQKDSNPTVVSLLLSLESVFAVLAGAVILHDRMSGKEYLGCVLMLVAVVLAQLPEKAPKTAENKI